MELFADLRDAGYFQRESWASVPIEILLWWCYSEGLGWVCETVEQSQDSPFQNSSMSRRNELYYLPHRFGSRDCGFQVEQAELDALPEASLSMTPCGDPNMQEYLDFAMEHNRIQKPENWESASELYMKLKEMAQLWNDQKVFFWSGETLLPVWTQYLWICHSKLNCLSVK